MFQNLENLGSQDTAKGPRTLQEVLSLAKAYGQGKTHEILAHFSDDVTPNVDELCSEQNNPSCQIGTR